MHAVPQIAAASFDSWMQYACVRHKDVGLLPGSGTAYARVVLHAVTTILAHASFAAEVPKIVVEAAEIVVQVAGSFGENVECLVDSRVITKLRTESNGTKGLS